MSAVAHVAGAIKILDRIEEETRGHDSPNRNRYARQKLIRELAVRCRAELTAALTFATKRAAG